MPGTLANSIGVKDVSFSDGESAEFVDFNALQRYERALMLDGLLGQMARLGESVSLGTVAGPLAANLYSLGAGGSPIASGAARGVTNVNGTIVQGSGASFTGTDANTLSYVLADNELQTTLAIGDAVNPRYDAICVQLALVADDSENRDFQDAVTLAWTSQTTNKIRRVALTKQVVQGTPAASPAVPSPPAGFAIWAVVYVPANYNAAFVQQTHILDYRYPMGQYSTAFVGTGQGTGGMIWTPTTDWAMQSDGSLVATAAGKILYVVCPGPARQAGRILGIQKHATITGTGDIRLQRVDMGAGAPSWTDLGSINQAAGLWTPFGTSPLGGAPTTLTFASNAWWANGYAGGPAAGSSGTTYLGLKVTSGANTDRVSGFRWEMLAAT